MKTGIHPNYQTTKVICACGNTFEVESNKKELHLEVCSKCHPFFTNSQGRTSKTGRIEKFNKKFGLSEDK
ncbi:MAG: 50S ribosomal protein L31 [Bacilli bacterium]|nr:50S ribosomal protein L31 [Bacilli bacterium]